MVPLRRWWNGGDEGDWSPEERRQVLHEKLRSQLPQGFPKPPSTPSEKQKVVDSLRLIAYAVHSEVSDILSLS